MGIKAILPVVKTYLLTVLLQIHQALQLSYCDSLQEEMCFLDVDEIIIINISHIQVIHKNHNFS